MSSTLSEAELKKIKRRVLNKHVVTLVDDLGSPVRYFPALTSKEILTLPDRERIQHKITAQEKVQVLVDILSEDRGGERAPFDVLVEVLKEGRVHTSVATGLEKALEKELAKAMEKLRLEGMCGCRNYCLC